MEKELTENNRFYPLPSELQRGEFLEHLFTPVSGNLALTSYLAEALQQVAQVYQQDSAEERSEARKLAFWMTSLCLILF